MFADRILAFIHGQGRPAWLVGGYVRDRLLGRPSHDLDLVVPEGGIRLARDLARAFGGAWFALDEERDVGRAILSGDDAPLEVDVARLRLPELVDDLALRDFTANAIAMDLAADGGPRIIDPFDGQADLERKLLRAVTEGAFRDDPLRMLRGVRMVAELGFRLEGATYNLVRRDAGLLPAAASERVRDEMMRVLAAPAAWQHLRLLDDLALLRHVLPESASQIGVTQSAPHYQDVFDHTRSVLLHLRTLYTLLWPDMAPAPPAEEGTVLAPADQWAEAAALLAPYAAELREHLCLPLASGHVRRDLLVWAAVAHDWGKPARRTVTPQGDTHFYDHDHWGALLAEARLQALKFAGDEVAYVARLVDYHMRPGHLAHDYPPSRRAIYRFFRDAESTGPDCVLLSLADTMATRATAPDPEGWQRRLGASRMLLDAYFRERAVWVSPTPLLNGRQVMAELGLPPGPQVGALIAGLREAQATGEVQTAEEAARWLRRQMAAQAEE